VGDSPVQVGLARENILAASESPQIARSLVLTRLREELRKSPSKVANTDVGKDLQLLEELNSVQSERERLAAGGEAPGLESAPNFGNRGIPRQRPAVPFRLHRVKFFQELQVFAHVSVSNLRPGSFATPPAGASAQGCARSGATRMPRGCSRERAQPAPGCHPPAAAGGADQPGQAALSVAPESGHLASSTTLSRSSWLR